MTKPNNLLKRAKYYQNTLLKSVVLLSLLLLVVTSHDVLAQSTAKNNQPKSSEDSKAVEQKIDALSERERELIQRMDKKDVELAELKTKIETTNSILNTVFVALAIFLGIGTFFSVFGWIKSESRAVAAHRFGLSSAEAAEERTKQAFTIAIAGETAAQQRASQIHENFLEGSTKTLQLVNATLSLAKEASERAAKIIERRARTMVEELDRESQSLLASVPAQDDRALIANPANRSNLRSVAQKIAAFEINRFVLPEDIQLTPPCLFIRGMDFHLSQQFEDAILNWRNVALAQNTSDGLRSLAWYWIGYEQNNLNRFDDAEQSFENALKTATGERKYELQRILIETRFFNKKKNPARNLILPLEHLLTAITNDVASEELEARRIKIVITSANVISQIGRELAKDGQSEESLEMFRKAKGFYEEVAERDKWALFGLAEMLFELGEVERAQQIFVDKVRNAAIDESVRREEPRTKVLARTTELICCLRVPKLNREAPSIRSLVLQDLGRVDERLTVYSQIQKRNVTKAEFQDDLDELMQTQTETM